MDDDGSSVAGDATRDLGVSTADVAEQVTNTLLTTVRDVALDFVAHLPLIAAGLVVLLLTWVVAAIFRRSSRNLLSRTKLRGSLRELIERLALIGIWGLGAMLAAMVVLPGLTPARAMGGLGLASVAIGFAFKDVFENFFAGILILWRFPIERGDFIACEGILGRVEEVTVRMTQLRRPTGELVIVPNGFLFKNPVEVLTHEPTRRISLATGVAYDVDVSQAVEVIQAALGGCETVSTATPPEVLPSAFGPSSIDIDIHWWTDPQPLAERRSRAEVLTAVKAALDDAGIEIPFPQRTLTFGAPLAVASEAPGPVEAG